jgi:hypothetical protein
LAGSDVGECGCASCSNIPCLRRYSGRQIKYFRIERVKQSDSLSSTFAYSVLAAMRTQISAPAPFHSVRKFRHAAADGLVASCSSPLSSCARICPNLDKNYSAKLCRQCTSTP